jgi:hypothetical protein
MARNRMPGESRNGIQLRAWIDWLWLNRNGRFSRDLLRLKPFQVARFSRTLPPLALVLQKMRQRKRNVRYMGSFGI